MTIKLILLRHGESEWNAKNLFTGWVDVRLSASGESEAKRGGALLAERGLLPDLVHTSLLRRAIHTSQLALDACDRHWIPVSRSWRLNERHYGALTGLNKAETAAKFGDEQVHIWRRSYAIAPPPLSPEQRSELAKDPRYTKLKHEDIPLGECLKDTVSRVLPLWNESIAPALKLGKRVILVAHGNSIRALMKHIDQVSDEAIMEVNVPNGNPLVYELDDELRPIQHFYLQAK